MIDFVPDRAADAWSGGLTQLFNIPLSSAKRRGLDQAAPQAVEKVRRTFSTPSQYLDFLAALLPENLPLRGANACWRRLFAGI
ncbi:hypothetical protein [Dysosmobacter sp.]|uniref:hypothetical protein n=1 Tax=Dysosmobacter sp. TaxID=2591382 RepID=UPI002A8BA250|nr:hypothetical protein [Dysosmobacter sp.]MDY3984493.1 hypothetical protein [Dysosmobacter sp.]